jgi:hypothetical protein
MGSGIENFLAIEKSHSGETAKITFSEHFRNVI